MKNILVIALITMTALIGVTWYAKSKDIKITNLLSKKEQVESNWKWSNDWNKSEEIKKEETPKEPVKPSEIVLVGYQDALKKSAEEGKPVLVMFTASWCSWCNKFKKEVLTDDNVKVACSKYIFTMVDAETEKALLRKFGISSLPSFVITNSKEQNLKSQSGYMDSVKFINWLNNPNLLEQPKVEPKTEPQSPPAPQNRRFQRQQH